VLRKDRTVVIDLQPFLAWLKRIDPVAVAQDAIGEYVRDRWGEVDDDGTEAAEHEDAMRRVLAEVAEGFAVSDADIAPEPEDTGAGMSPQPAVRDTRGGPRS
jgi:hypothetical protein